MIDGHTQDFDWPLRPLRHLVCGRAVDGSRHRQDDSMARNPANFARDARRCVSTCVVLDVSRVYNIFTHRSDTAFTSRTRRVPD
jgi:hypothetical protein